MFKWLVNFFVRVLCRAGTHIFVRVFFNIDFYIEDEHATLVSFIMLMFLYFLSHHFNPTDCFEEHFLYCHL